MATGGEHRNYGTADLAPMLAAAGFKEVAYKDDRLPKRKHRYQRRDMDYWGLPIAIEHPPSGIVFILIPGGKFDSGVRYYDPIAGAPGSPATRLELNPFYLSVSPVTQRQWSRGMGTNPSTFCGDDHPVESITRDDVSDFLEAAGSGIRLPYEVEWERAVRGGSAKIYWWGDEYRAGSANCKESDDDQQAVGTTTSVSRYKCNPFGLLDMLGNVWEWVEDKWMFESSDWPLPDDNSWYDGGERWGTIRGGSWHDPPLSLRCSERRGWPETDAASFVGFRVARSVR